MAVFLAVTMAVPSPAFAQAALQAGRGLLGLPAPGMMVNLSPGFIPTTLRGIRLYPDNPFKFDFIVDSGNTGFKGADLKGESEKIIKYFLASLTIPEEDVWVNLSPYEKDRIITEALGATEMGRDMLAQDYLLKQITASLINPQEDLGKQFWDKVYAKAYEQFGTTSIPMNTFNKVWIVPGEATVYEDGDKAYLIDFHLKVMVEEDYLAQKVNNENSLVNSREMNQAKNTSHDSPDAVHSSSNVSTQVMRQVIIPALEKEVNEGQNFTLLRQITASWVLATWFKKNLKDALLNRLYSDQRKTPGVHVDDPKAKDKIYQQYIKAFKKGVCDFIKVDYDPYVKKNIPRKYFSGGVAYTSSAIKIVSRSAQGLWDKFREATRPLVRSGRIFVMTGLMVLSSLTAPAADLPGVNTTDDRKSLVLDGSYGGVKRFDDSMLAEEFREGLSPLSKGEEKKDTLLASLSGLYGSLKLVPVPEAKEKNPAAWDNLVFDDTGENLGKVRFEIVQEGNSPFLRYTFYSYHRDPNGQGENFLKGERDPAGSRWQPTRTYASYQRMTGKEPIAGALDFGSLREKIHDLLIQAYNFGVTDEEIARGDLKANVLKAYRDIQRGLNGLGAPSGIFKDRDELSLFIDSGMVQVVAEGQPAEKIFGVREQLPDYVVTYEAQQDQRVNIFSFGFDASGTISRKNFIKQIDAAITMVQEGRRGDLYLLGLSAGEKPELQKVLEEKGFMTQEEALKFLRSLRPQDPGSASELDRYLGPGAGGWGNTKLLELSDGQLEKMIIKKAELEKSGNKVRIVSFKISDYSQDPSTRGKKSLTREELENGTTREDGYTIPPGYYKEIHNKEERNGVRVVNIWVQNGEPAPLVNLLEGLRQKFYPVDSNMDSLVAVVQQAAADQVEKPPSFDLGVPNAVDAKDIIVYAMDKKGHVMGNPIDGHGDGILPDQVQTSPLRPEDGVVDYKTLNEKLSQLSPGQKAVLTFRPGVREHDLKKIPGKTIFRIDVSTSMTGREDLEDAIEESKKISSDDQGVSLFSDEEKESGERGGFTNVPLGLRTFIDSALEKGERIKIYFVCDLNSNRGHLGRFLLSRREGKSISRIEELMEQGSEFVLVTTNETKSRIKMQIDKQEKPSRPSDVLSEKPGELNNNLDIIFAYLVQLTSGQKSGNIISGMNLAEALKRVNAQVRQEGRFQVSGEFKPASVIYEIQDGNGNVIERKHWEIKDDVGVRSGEETGKKVINLKGNFKKWKRAPRPSSPPAPGKIIGKTGSSDEKTFVVTEEYLQGFYQNQDKELKKIEETVNQILAGPMINPDQMARAIRSVLEKNKKFFANVPTPGSFNGTKGGIDLNADALELKTQGQGIDLMLPQNLEAIDPSQVPGFVPVIINIMPIMDISDLWDNALGEAPLALK